MFQLLDVIADFQTAAKLDKEVQTNLDIEDLLSYQMKASATTANAGSHAHTIAIQAKLEQFQRHLETQNEKILHERVC